MDATQTSEPTTEGTKPTPKPTRARGPRQGKGKDFQLESPTPGKVPESVVEELRRLRTRANDAGTAFRDAVKIQAEKNGVKPSALRRYVNAIASDKVDELEAEARHIVVLAA